MELEHALLIHLGYNGFKHTRVLYKDVLELCGPIVEKRKEYITFIHFSAKDYSRTQPFAVPLYKMLNQYSPDISPGIRPMVGTAFGKPNPMLRSL